MTKEYIEREAAINGLAKIIVESDMPEDWNKGMSAAVSALFRIPAADVVERASGIIGVIPAADVRPVVTCGECKHSCDMPGGLRCVYGTCLDCYVEPEFFCADGKKREG